MAPPPLSVVHLDEYLLAVSKPAGLLAVPGRGEDKQDCLSARIQAWLPDARVVHRLDMATSGLLLMARSASVQRALGRAFEAQRIHKRYEALVHGHMQAHDAHWQSIELPIGPDWPRRPRQQVDLLRGKPSLTRWRLLAREGSASRIALEPLTGRTHQLRVHLEALGHPILGDALYAPHAGACAPRLMLHACQLALDHPVTGQPLQLHDPTPF